mgnify:CR=1 FL=1
MWNSQTQVELTQLHYSQFHSQLPKGRHHLLALQASQLRSQHRHQLILAPSKSAIKRKTRHPFSIEFVSMSTVRTDLKMADGRTIFYYDNTSVTRNAVDNRPQEDRPGVGELRLDLLTNEWVAMAAHRQARAFLPPKELCPLCPTKGKPCISSSAPGASPINITSALGLPSQKTVLIAVSFNAHSVNVSIAFFNSSFDLNDIVTYIFIIHKH